MKNLLLFFFILCFQQTASAQFQKDSIAIINLLQKESTTWRSGDVEAHASCWHIQPYSRILVSLADGKVLDVPPSFMINPSPGSMGTGGSFILSNYKMSIHQNHAWVSHDEESISKSGAKTYSYEIRMLEKIKGEWKLVGQSIHIYKQQ